MNKYTIYCTQEQVKKSIELGAPVVLSEKREVYNDYPQEIPGKIGKYFTFEEAYSCCFCNDYGAYIIPTAEQMIGWLRSKGFRFRITEFKEGTLWKVTHGDWFDFSDNDGINPKEATLAAIDAALKYLENNLIK